jgi:hypothetical protein
MKHLKYTAMLASTALLAISAVQAADSPVIDTPAAPSDTQSSATQDYSYYCTALHNNYSTLYISGVSKESWPWQRGFIEATVNPAWAKAVQGSYPYIYNPNCIEGPSATIQARRQQQVDMASSHGQQVVEINWHY